MFVSMLWVVVAVSSFVVIVLPTYTKETIIIRNNKSSKPNQNERRFGFFFRLS